MPVVHVVSMSRTDVQVGSEWGVQVHGKEQEAHGWRREVEDTGEGGIGCCRQNA